MAISAYTAARSSPLQRSCPLAREDIPNLNRPIAENEPTVDKILSAAYQSIDFWSRLKGCQTCLKGRLEELLATYDRIIGVLQVTAALFHVPDPASNESRKDPADSLCLETAALRYQPPTSPAPTASALVSASGVVPPMFLGELRLNHEQSLALLRTVCDDTLKRLAAILYEMR